jgi:hypothetical protein
MRFRTIKRPSDGNASGEGTGLVDINPLDFLVFNHEEFDDIYVLIDLFN